MKTHRIGWALGFALWAMQAASAAPPAPDAVSFASNDGAPLSATARAELDASRPVSSEAAKSFTFQPGSPNGNVDLGNLPESTESTPPALSAAAPAAVAATSAPVEAYRPASPLPGSPSAAADSSAPSAIALTAAPANAIALNTLPANAPAADMTAAPDDVQSTFATSFGADAIKGNPVRMTTYKVRDMSNQVYEDLSAKLAREAYERTLLPLYTTDITTDVRFAGTTIDRDGSRRVSGLSLLSFNW